MKAIDQERFAKLYKALDTPLTDEQRQQTSDELEWLVAREMYRAELRRLPKPQLDLEGGK